MTKSDFLKADNNTNNKSAVPADCEHQKPPWLISKRLQVSPITTLVVVEGVNDIEFLRRISHIVTAIDSSCPNLKEWEEAGRIVFLPFGGGSASAWSTRLAPLGLPEFHLYDRETEPESALRNLAAHLVNARPNCVAAVTHKRSLENYLHPAAVLAMDGLTVEFGDFDAVTEAVAKAQFVRKYDSASWESLPKRGRDRWSRRTKYWLNTKVVALMTPEMLAESDPDQEIVSWFRAIRDLSKNLC
jgi:hypothetical protein